jgi:hypothetical protein
MHDANIAKEWPGLKAAHAANAATGHTGTKISAKAAHVVNVAKGFPGLKVAQVVSAANGYAISKVTIKAALAANAAQRRLLGTEREWKLEKKALECIL